MLIQRNVNVSWKICRLLWNYKNKNKTYSYLDEIRTLIMRKRGLLRAERATGLYGDDQSKSKYVKDKPTKSKSQISKIQSI